MEAKLREGLKQCKTNKQVYTLLKKLGLKVAIETDSEWLECHGKDFMNIFLDKNMSTRIYGDKKKGYKLQLWNQTTEKIVGKKLVPQCHGYMMEVDDTVIINHGYNGILKGMK